MCHDSTQLHNLSVPKKSVNGQSSDILNPSVHPLFPKLSKAMHSYWHPNHNIPSYQWSAHLCLNRHDAEKKVYVFPLPHWSPTASIELVEGCRVQPILSEIGMIRFHHWMIVRNLPQEPRQNFRSRAMALEQALSGTPTYWLTKAVLKVNNRTWSLPALFLRADFLGFAYQPPREMVTTQQWHRHGGGHRRRLGWYSSLALCTYTKSIQGMRDHSEIHVLDHCWAWNKSGPTLSGIYKMHVTRK